MGKIENDLYNKARYNAFKIKEFCDMIIHQKAQQNIIGSNEELNWAKIEEYYNNITRISKYMNREIQEEQYNNWID